MDAAIGFSPEGVFKTKLTSKIHNGLRCYEVIDGEVTGMSLVTNPAHSRKAKIISDEQRLIAGAMLVPDHMIYRMNPITGEEHYIYFTAEVIKILSSKYLEKNWSQVDGMKLLAMYVDCKSVNEIADKLERTEENVAKQLELEGQPFLDCALVLMLQSQKTYDEIAERMKLNKSDILEAIVRLGGRIVPLNGNNDNPSY